MKKETSHKTRNDIVSELYNYSAYLFNREKLSCLDGMTVITTFMTMMIENVAMITGDNPEEVAQSISNTILTFFDQEENKTKNIHLN